MYFTRYTIYILKHRKFSCLESIAKSKNYPKDFVCSWSMEKERKRKIRKRNERGKEK